MNSLLLLVGTLLLSVPFMVTTQNGVQDSLKSIDYYVENKLVSNTLFFYSENNEMELSVNFEENTVFLKVLSKKDDITTEVNYVNNAFIDSTIYRYSDGILRDKEVIYLPELNRELPNAFSKTENVISRYDIQGEILELIFIDNFIGDTSRTHYEMQNMGDTVKVRKSIVDSPKFNMNITDVLQYPTVSIDSFFYYSHNLLRSVSYSNDKFQNQVCYKYDSDNRVIERLQLTTSHSKNDFISYKKAGKKSKKEVFSNTEVRGMIVENQEVYIYRNDMLIKEFQVYGRQKVYEIGYKYDRNRRLILEKRFTFQNGRVKKLYSEKIYKYAS